MINIKEVNKENFMDVINLKVKDEQRKFVADNVFSIAQSKVYPECIPQVIYNDDLIIGFAMYAFDDDEGEYCIYRLMIDEKYQSKGLGTQALNCLIKKIQMDRSRHVMFISFESENEIAKSLYEKVGFKYDNRTDESGELMYRLDY